MEFLKGLGFFLLTIFILLNVARGIIPCLIIIGVSTYFFPWWYAMMMTGLCISACFGRELSLRMEYGDRSMLQIQYGFLFDLVGNGIAFIGLLIGVFSCLFS